MKCARRFLQRLRAPFKRGGREDLAAELETHLELLTEENVRRGLSPADACRAATRLGEPRRSLTAGTSSVCFRFDTVPRDVRFAIRRLIGILAGIAVLLGIVGVYGVPGHLVGQRRQEIAVRVALGATRWEIVWLVARRGVVLGVIGVAFGLAGSAALSRVVESTLFGVSALDPLTHVLAPALLLAVVVAASSLPAWRATRFSAIEALRSE